jgi:hypothetical protein
MNLVYRDDLDAFIEALDLYELRVVGHCTRWRA